ncbi:MAG: DUF2442 domain-containing protein [Propionivibrio sp.]|uniref:DUF2442 domain-containing protein n=1 Tax=Candidatus Propionivibrio dominans TaxID=2954373 RepID=A0A9D7FDQ7_9RHOO|nr:DUF2442 domain-containing protein [Candidatus Propionivibrio dominans]
MTPDVTNVVVVGNFELLVSFADGARRRFSMRPYLEYPVYQALKEPGKFKLAHVLNGTVAWSDDIDISPDTLYLEKQTSGNDAQPCARQLP